MTVKVRHSSKVKGRIFGRARARAKNASGKNGNLFQLTSGRYARAGPATYRATYLVLTAFFVVHSTAVPRRRPMIG